MLNKRMIARSIVATTAAAALAFTTVGVAQADDHAITKLPAKASLQAGQSVSVDIATDEGFACDSWTTRVVGKKRMRTNVTVSGPESLEGCDIGQLITFQVSLDEEFTKKGRAVVKFIVLSADGSDKKVKSLVTPALVTDDGVSFVELKSRQVRPYTSTRRIQNFKLTTTSVFRTGVTTLDASVS